MRTEKLLIFIKHRGAGAVCAAILLLAALFSVPARAESIETYAIVHRSHGKNVAHLRETASEDSASLGIYYGGTYAKVNGSQDGWASVTIGYGEGSLSGYMSEYYLEYLPMETVTEAGYGGDNPILRVTEEAAQLHAAQSESSNVICQIPQGTRVTVLGKKDTWYHVLAGSICGFIHYDAFSITLSASEPAEETEYTGSEDRDEIYAIVQNPDPADRLNLRKTASTKSESLGKYYNGTCVKVNGSKNGWASVTVGCGEGSLSGYMKEEYLVYLPLEEATDSTLSIAAPVMKIYADSGYLYAAPSAGSDIICMLPNRTRVTVLGVYGKWYHVLAGGIYGFLYNDAFSSGSQSIANEESTYGRITEGCTVYTTADGTSTPENSDTTTYGLHSTDDIVIVYGTSGEYTCVNYATRKGYVLSEYVTAYTPPTPSDGETEATAGFWSTDVYAEESTSPSSILCVPEGMPLAVMEYNEEWAKVNLGFTIGYVQMKDLDF